MSIEKEIHQKRFRSGYQKALINIIYTGNWLNLQSLHGLKPYGITLQQFNVLRILRGQYPHPATVNMIIERMLDKMSNVSRIVDKLHTKGLVNRKECPEDRRKVDITITQEGRDLLKKLDILDREWESQLTPLSADEIVTLNRLLDKIRG